MNCLIKLFILSCLVGFYIETQAQNNLSPKKDTLLWYTGKKTGPHTLVTDNGMKIILDPKTGALTTSFPKGKDPLETVVEKTKTIEKDEEELANKVKTETDEDNIKMYPIVKEAIRYYEKLNEEMKEATTDKISGANDQAPPRQSGDQKMVQLIVDFCNFYKKDYELIIQYAKQCKSEKNPEVPDPPSADYYNCWACDAAKQKDYEQKVKEYDSSFSSEEAPYIRKILSIQKSLALFNMDGGAAEGVVAEHYSEIYGSMKHPGACAYLDKSKLNDALYDIMLHVVEKANVLWKKYHKDHQKLEPVIMTILGVYRQAMLLGVLSQNSEDPVLAEMGAEAHLFAGELSGKLGSGYDYTMLPMIPFIIGTYRLSYLLGTNEVWDEKIMTKVLKANIFRLTIDVNTKLGKGSVHQIMEYHTDGHIIAVFDSTKCLRWLPAGVKDKQKNMWVYTQLRQATVICPQINYTYTGTHDFYLNFDFHAHLCKDASGSDTFFVQPALIPGTHEVYFWQMDGRPTAAPFDGMSGFRLFTDSQKDNMALVSQIQSGDFQKNINDILANSQNAMKMAQQMQASGASQKDMAARLSETFTTTNNSNDLFSKIVSMMTGLPVSLNKGKVLIEQTFNAADFNKSAVKYGFLESGTLKLHIEHIDTDE